MLRLLAHSWEDIGYEYDGLTSAERSCITREEFDTLVRLMVGQEIVTLSLEEA